MDLPLARNRKCARSLARSFGVVCNRSQIALARRISGLRITVLLLACWWLLERSRPFSLDSTRYIYTYWYCCCHSNNNLSSNVQPWSTTVNKTCTYELVDAYWRRMLAIAVWNAVTAIIRVLLHQFQKQQALHFCSIVMGCIQLGMVVFTVSAFFYTVPNHAVAGEDFQAGVGSNYSYYSSC